MSDVTIRFAHSSRPILSEMLVEIYYEWKLPQLTSYWED